VRAIAPKPTHMAKCKIRISHKNAFIFGQWGLFYFDHVFLKRKSFEIDKKLLDVGHVLSLHYW
jgi:hypothetical protein